MLGALSQSAQATAAPYTSHVNWFYSPGFAGVAAILAAVIALLAAVASQRIAAAATATRAASDRKLEEDAVKRELQAYLRRCLVDIHTLSTAFDPGLASYAAASLGALIERSHERDVARSLTDQQIFALRSAASVAQNTTPALERAASGDMVDLNGRLVLASAILCVALHWLDPADTFWNYIGLPEEIKSARRWKLFYEKGVKPDAFVRPA